MIMRPGSDQLLLPVNPLFITLTLLLALAINLLPLGRQPAQPDLVALVLVFWNVHQPRRVGVGVAFAFGLLIDVHEGALLGQHALAYTLLSYGAIREGRHRGASSRHGPRPARPAEPETGRRCSCCRAFRDNVACRDGTHLLGHPTLR
jgi:hypothetical protein